MGERCRTNPPGELLVQNSTHNVAVIGPSCPDTQALTHALNSGVPGTNASTGFDDQGVINTKIIGITSRKTNRRLMAKKYFK